MTVQAALPKPSTPTIKRIHEPDHEAALSALRAVLEAREGEAGEVVAAVRDA